ncbi:hypothetical protein ACHMW4_20340 [Mesorhizobium sp. UC22_110]|uniref:hypothetical protein n=1 Tax=Mesorhizobium sp. UC22_110 TaxID=3374552 RepID=UPI003756AFAB
MPDTENAATTSRKATTIFQGFIESLTGAPRVHHAKDAPPLDLAHELFPESTPISGPCAWPGRDMISFSSLPQDEYKFLFRS